MQSSGVGKVVACGTFRNFMVACESFRKSFVACQTFAVNLMESLFGLAMKTAKIGGNAHLKTFREHLVLFDYPPQSLKCELPLHFLYDLKIMP
jgi:hypothetical protein